MKKAIASVGLLALGAVGVTSARADWAAGVDKPWSLSGTLRGFYDDNYNTQPDGPGRVSSFGFEVRPQVAVNFSTGPTTLTASYTYSMKYYDERQPDKTDQSHDVELFLNHNFNERFSADLEESFVDAQEPQVLSGNGAITFPLRANGDNFRNTASINFHAQLTHLLGIVLGYANSYYDYTGNPPTPGPGQAIGPSYGDLLNRFEHTVTFNTRWMIEPETTGILGYQFVAVDYINTGSITGPAGPFNPNPYISPSSRNNYTHNIYAGVEHSFRSDLSFSGRAGVQVSDYYNAPSGSSAGDIGPFVDLSLNFAYMAGGSLTVGFRQSKNQTDVSGATSAGQLTQDQESSTVYASVVQQLTPISPNLTASVSGQFQNSVYNGGAVNDESDTFYLVGLNLTYQFNHYISTEVGYNYDLLDSDLAGRGYDRNRVYIGVTATY